MGTRYVCTDLGVPNRELVLEQLEERIVLDGAVADTQDVVAQQADGGQVDSLGWISTGNGWWYEDNGSGWWWEEATGWYWNENTGWWVLNSGDFSYWYHGDHQYWANEISTGAWFWWDDVTDQIWEPAFTWFADQVNTEWAWVYNDWNGSFYYTDDLHNMYQDHNGGQMWWFDAVTDNVWELYQTWFADGLGGQVYNDLNASFYDPSGGTHFYLQQDHATTTWTWFDWVESQTWEPYQTSFTDPNGILQYNTWDTTTYTYGNGLYTYVQNHLVAGENDAPQIGVSGTQTATENTDTLISGIAVLDIDAGLNDVEATLSVAHGTLTFGSVTGLTFTTGTGNHDTTMVFTGSQDAINAALANLTYTGDPAFAGTDNLDVTINDLGNTGTGGQLISTQSIQIDVADVPSLTGFADTYNLNHPTDILQFSLIQNLVVSDMDSPWVTVSIFVDSGTLASTAGTFAAGTWSITDTVANVQTVLDNLTYSQVGPGGTVNATTHIVDASGNSPVDGAFQIVVNDIPSLTGFLSSYSLGSPTETLAFTGIIITDADLENVTVNVQVSSGTLASSLGGAFAAGTWTMTDTVANVQGALNALVFTPSTAGYVTVTTHIIDAQGNSPVDGTFSISVSGAALLQDINPGTAASNPGNFLEFQGELYFTASDATGGHLFKIDPAIGLASVVPGSPTAGGGLVIFDGDLYFAGNDATYGTELWKMDGASGAFTRCTDIYGGTGSSYPSSLVVYNNDLYFAANTAAFPNPNTELWVYHIDPVSGIGTAQLAADCWVGSSSGYPSNLTVFNGDLYFAAYDTASNNGNELWRYHADPGQIVGTGTRISNIAAGTASSSPMFLTVFNDSLYFRANSASSIISPANSELWKVDINGTVSLAKDLWVGGNGDTSYLTVLNGNLYFAGNDGTGVKIWMMTPDETFSSLAWAGTASGAVKYLYAFNNDLYFQGYSAAQGYELWKYDDTTGTASLLQDIWPGANPNNGLSLAPNFYAYNGDLYFLATDGSTGAGHGYELWKYDPAV
ncbi:hypothetical protein [Desulfomonile tiedjei]|uniref:Uncharacterized protein n=1 Tax=Desulfomonile tiedjei (strain ATCC 49306 / DSM 6799 / DCB-1) TaxID=706587 RepID=I4C7Y1_DESTA|nr:hypothetical protein [Desulfomonile tiedjei]AFM25672.1 hypothetical protein Desti_3007 [Desulfomonile tiedjei DSM 6799]